MAAEHLAHAGLARYEAALNRMERHLAPAPYLPHEKAAVVLHSALCDGLASLGLPELRDGIRVGQGYINGTAAVSVMFTPAVVQAFGVFDPEVHALLRAGCWPVFQMLLANTGAVGPVLARA